jgi:hypothetical protein
VVLKECPGDVFVYNEEDYQRELEANRGRNIHLVEKCGKTLKWMKTSGDISGILKYIDEV